MIIYGYSIVLLYWHYALYRALVCLLILLTSLQFASFVSYSVSKLIGYESDELLGNSLYNYHHALDGELIAKTYKSRKLS